MIFSCLAIFFQKAVGLTVPLEIEAEYPFD